MEEIELPNGVGLTFAPVWTTNEGKRIGVNRLSTSHLINIDHLLRRGERRDSPMWNAINSEIRRRMNPADIFGQEYSYFRSSGSAGIFGPFQ